MTKKILSITLTLFGASLATASFAQVKADGNWRGSGGAALSATSGNTSSTSLLLNADAVRATASDKIILGGAINYARSKVAGVQETTANKWALGGEYQYNLTPRVYGFGKLGLEADKLIFLSRRAALTTGLGYKVIDTPDLTFDVLGGVGYITDKYSSAQTIAGKTDTSFSRATLYLAEESNHKLSSTTSFKQRLDLYPGVSGDKAFLAKFSAGLSVAMSNTMNLTVGVTDAYNSKPGAGLKKNDFGFFTGVNVKFGAL